MTLTSDFEYLVQTQIEAATATLSFLAFEYALALKWLRFYQWLQ
jgi:hypothetical protein